MAPGRGKNEGAKAETAKPATDRVYPRGDLRTAEEIVELDWIERFFRHSVQCDFFAARFFSRVALLFGLGPSPTPVSSSRSA